MTQPFPRFPEKQKPAEAGFLSQSIRLGRLRDKHVTDLTNRFGWVKTFRTYVYTVHDAVAAEYAEWVIKIS